MITQSTDAGRASLSPVTGMPILNTSEGGAFQSWNGSLWVMADGARSHFDEILADAPWSLWECLESSGTALADSSGSGNTGTSPQTISSSKRGRSIVRRSVKQSFKSLTGNIATVNDFPFGANWSMEYDCQFNSIGAGTLFFAADGSFSLHLEVDGSVTAQPKGDTIAPAGTILANTKYSLALTFNNGLALFYVNGVGVGSSSGNSVPGQQQAFWTMASATANSGQICNIALWTSTLTQSRIGAHWQSTGNWGKTPI